jgi:hypothetical protein
MEETMKYRRVFIAILLSFLSVISSHAEQGDFLIHTGLYFGQKQPGCIGKNASSEQMTRILSGRYFSGQSCTVFYASDEHMALAGNNEDYNFLSTNIIFLPAEEGKFGRVYFGSDVAHFPQGGMNEKGLFFDGAAIDTVIVVPRDTSKPVIKGQLILKAMEECSTVEEVQRLFTYYDFSGPMNGHYLIGDRFGNSVIIEPQTFINKRGKYQIITNFYQSTIAPEKITDYRYKIASQLLEQSATISVDLFRRILNATHFEQTHGEMITTLYSYICDLKKGDIYIYNFHNFEEVAKINLEEELKKGKRTCPILSLFPYMTHAERTYRFERIQRLFYDLAVKHDMEGEEGVISLYKSQANSISKDITLKLLTNSGGRLLEEGKLQEAIGIFKFIVSEDPAFSYGYEGLGEAYMKIGDRENAIKNYQKSLDLNPENNKAKEMLEKLGKR